MANLAAPDIGWKDDIGVIGDAVVESDDLIRLSRDNAWQLRAHVNFVDEDFEVDRVSGVGIKRLGRVAQNAHRYSAARSSVER